MITFARFAFSASSLRFCSSLEAANLTLLSSILEPTRTNNSLAENGFTTKINN